ncbi:MAG: hypothetical protein JNL89_11330 [Rhodanobacteraceae bacterium]|nr:hypothetical protein [Rhodanobacteraceae bacterium]
MTARTLEAAASDCATRIRDRLYRLRAAPSLADAAAVGALALLAWRALRARRHWRALAMDGALAWLTRGDPQ